MNVLEILKRAGSASVFRWEDGGALFETALALPLLSLALLGAAEFGLADYASIEVSNAAKAGAQYGAQSRSNAADTVGIQLAATQDAPNIALGSVNVARSTICSDSTATAGSPPVCMSGAAVELILTVKTQAAFNPVVHIPGITPSFTLNGWATQKVRQ
jgi:Flp pilus assembly protein TadG